jgi:uncharacterized protein (DUF2237 family)
MSYQKNIFGNKLQTCSKNPKTGYLRDGFCHFVKGDVGQHNVCARLTNKFLDFTESRGNDLRSIGLKEGDYWCLCISRWLQAYRYDPKIAPRLDLSRTNINVLDYVDFSILEKYSI